MNFKTNRPSHLLKGAFTIVWLMGVLAISAQAGHFEQPVRMRRVARVAGVPDLPPLPKPGAKTLVRAAAPKVVASNPFAQFSWGLVCSRTNGGFLMSTNLTTGIGPSWIVLTNRLVDSVSATNATNVVLLPHFLPAPLRSPRKALLPAGPLLSNFFFDWDEMTRIVFVDGQNLTTGKSYQFQCTHDLLHWFTFQAVLWTETDPTSYYRAGKPVPPYGFFTEYYRIISP